MGYVVASPATLAQFHRLYRAELRSYANLVKAARAGILPGVVPAKFGFHVVDQKAALEAMRKDTASRPAGQAA